jgi:hypothetical protein
VEEASLLEPDVDEGGLDPRKDRLHTSLVDVAHQALRVRVVRHQLHQDVVLDDRHPRLLRGGGHQDLALHAIPPSSCEYPVIISLLEGSRPADRCRA